MIKQNSYTKANESGEEAQKETMRLIDIGLPQSKNKVNINGKAWEFVKQNIMIDGIKGLKNVKMSYQVSKWYNLNEQRKHLGYSSELPYYCMEI